MMTLCGDYKGTTCGIKVCCYECLHREKCENACGKQNDITKEDFDNGICEFIIRESESMGDIMEFPNTFDEFASAYGFVDKDEVYTNGSELIPVFRVEQWLEHIQKPTQMVDKSNFDKTQYQADLTSAYDCGYTIGKSERETTTLRKVSEFTREDSEGFKVKYNVFCCNECGRLMRYRWLEDGHYFNYCDWCGRKITNMPFEESESE